MVIVVGTGGGGDVVVVIGGDDGGCSSGRGGGSRALEIYIYKYIYRGNQEYLQAFFFRMRYFSPH